MKLLAFALLVAVFAVDANAQPRGNARAGEAYARDVCAACHVVESAAMSTPATGPRSFAEIAADPKMTDTALRVFLTTPHERMPDFILDPDRMDDLIAYIRSLEM